MKTCSKCKVSKEEVQFNKNYQQKSGLNPSCRECYNKLCLKYAHSEQGKLKRTEYNKVWSKENAHKKNATSRGRQTAKLKALPSWANIEIIKGLYKQAKELEVSTGIKHDVDHIVPLRSKLVCGLHVESNLRVIPSVENRIKGNKVWPNCP